MGHIVNMSQAIGMSKSSFIEGIKLPGCSLLTSDNMCYSPPELAVGVAMLSEETNTLQYFRKNNTVTCLYGSPFPMFMGC
jgi:hypothetical protein